MGQQKKQASITIFCSYASVDRQWYEQLVIHLSQLKRDGLIETWSDQQILAGSDRTQEIDHVIHHAQIVLLFISADFLASDLCYHIEMQQALERHKRGEARVVPIIVRPCDWQQSPFAHLQCLPRNTQPITLWNNQDEAFTAITQELSKIVNRQRPLGSPLSSSQKRFRDRLLKQVRSTWIKGLFESSLRHTSLIDLDLQDQTDALANPWSLQVQELHPIPSPLPSGTSIIELYDQADGELLILGEPGSGKTTLLLQLTCTLLDRAEANERFPIPVVFNLSSWTQKQKSLDTWLIKELKTKYYVPSQISSHLVKTNQILPLLDGLDEVASEARQVCAHAIIEYQQQEKHPPVVSCRMTEYQGLSQHFPWNRAISPLPLTKEQIEMYISVAHGQLDVLRQALLDDAELYNLAQRPLMLNICTLTYQGATSKDLPTNKNVEELRQRIFTTYVDKMLNRRGVSKHFSGEQIKRWLVFLAGKMQEQQNTLFYIEELQVNWLNNRYWRLLYHLTVFLIPILLFLLVIGIFSGPITGLIFAALLGIPYGMIFGFAHIRLEEKSSKWRESRVTGKVMRLLLELPKGLVLSVGIGSLTLGIFMGILSELVSFPNASLLQNILENLRSEKGSPPLWFIILTILVVIYLTNYLYRGLRLPFKDTEAIFSVKEAIRGITLLIITPLLWFGLLSTDSLATASVGHILLFLFANALLSSFLAYLLTGLITNSTLSKYDYQWLNRPNQGIWMCVSGGLRMGCACGLVGLVIGYLFNWGDRFPSSILGSVEFGLSIGLMAMLSFGFGLFLQHFVLRFWLWRAKKLPWNMVAFLDEAVERLLMHKIGGCYIFVHQNLLEYLAALSLSIPTKKRSSNHEE